MLRNKPRTTVTINLDPDLLAKVDALAEREVRSRTAQIRWMMLRVLRELECSAEVSSPPGASSGGEGAAA